MDDYKLHKKAVNGVFGMLSAVKALIIVISLSVGYIIKYVTGLSNSETNNLLEKINSYDNIYSLIFNIALYLLFSLVPILFYFGLKDKADVKKDLLLKRPTIMQAGTTLGYTAVLAYSVSIVFNIIFQLISSVSGKNILPEASGAPANLWLIPLYFLSIAVFPAFCEEFMLRGALLGSMRKYGTGFAVFISSVCFSMLHNTIYQLPFALAAGLALGYCTIKFQSIWVAVIAHFFINFNSCMNQLIISFAGENYLMYTGIYNLIFFSLCAALAIAGMIVYGIRLPFKYRIPEHLKRIRFKLLFTSPFFYLFIFLFILMLGLNIIRL